MHSEGIMVRATEDMIQLATRIPARLHRAIRMHCVQDDTSVMEFVAEALQERLKKTQRRRRNGRKRRQR